MCVPYRQATHASHRRIAVMQIIDISLIATHKLGKNMISKIGV